MVILMPTSVSQRWRQVHNSIQRILRIISSIEIIEFFQSIHIGAPIFECLSKSHTQCTHH